MSYEKRIMDRREINGTVERLYEQEEISSDDIERRLLYDPTRVCTICEIGKGHNDGRDVREAAELAEILASHRRHEIEALVTRAQEKWESEQRAQLGTDGWSMLSCSDEDSKSAAQDSDSSVGWEIIDS